MLYSNNDDALKLLSKICSYKLKKFKYCYYCKITKTPMWRTGPKGYGTLCNACGIKYARKIKN
jgi:hypothetical protein